ncbi:MAG: cysteine hydrolase [Pseudomonadota bacterium]
MQKPENNRRAIIEGRPALLVIDIQRGSFLENEHTSIPHMPGYGDRLRKARQVIESARASNIPVIFVQEVHRPDMIDFGRELDGSEDVHCIEGRPNTEIAADVIDFRPNDYHVPKRRYSAFFGTDLEILLKGLEVNTLILIGGLTDVCVHYTFVDGHQHNYFCRVIEDVVAGSCEAAHEASLRAMEYLQAGARRSIFEMTEAMSDYGRASTR